MTGVFALAGCKKPPLSGEGKAIFALGRFAEKTALVAYGDGTCAARQDGRYCWGDDAVINGPTKFPRDGTAVALGGQHYCVLQADRTVWCAGNNLYGELGNGPGSTNAYAVVDGLGEVLQLAAASSKTCAIKDPGGNAPNWVMCWGYDAGHAVPRPRRVPSIDNARELAIDEGFACARLADASVWCWGMDTHGELGRGDEGMPWIDEKRPPTSVPVRVAHVFDAVGIAVGATHACVLTARGTVGCWGDNSYGALGDGTTRSRSYASEVVGLDDVVQIAAGSKSHTCARKRDGTVWCWGFPIGRVGEGERPVPERISRLEDIEDIALGRLHACARRKKGTILCWGHNGRKQLGMGTKLSAVVDPVPVMGEE